MSVYGELLLVIGDLHSAPIPQKLKALLVPDKMQRSFVTGNIGSSMDFIKYITPHVNVVAGDMDDEPFPEETVMDVGEFKIGLIHGHQVVPWGDKNALAIVARRLGVDILISGHTHAYSCEEHDGVWLLNPGSATGYYSPITDQVRPSFICMSVMGSTITNYVYILDSETGEVQVKKERFVKIEPKSLPSTPVPPTPVMPSTASPAVAAPPPVVESEVLDRREEEEVEEKEEQEPATAAVSEATRDNVVDEDKAQEHEQAQEDDVEEVEID